MKSAGIMRQKDTAEALRAKYGSAYGKTREVEPITEEQRAEIAAREQAAAAARARIMTARFRK